MRILLVQPPFVQLNSPYPACAYLKSFCERLGHEARTADLSIELFHEIFSPEGLRTVFDETAGELSARLGVYDAATRSNLIRYLSNAERYIEVIPRVKDLLSGRDEGFARELCSGMRIPYGQRAESFVESRGGAIPPEEAGRLASLIIEDLADFIGFAYDPGFSLVKYGERMTMSQPDFNIVERQLEGSRIMESFFAPLVRRYFERSQKPDLVCVTIPFPGALIGALAFARELAQFYGDRARGDGARPPVAFGGGYVNTELRNIRDPGIFGYADFLCFDSGYGALKSILECVGSRDRAESGSRDRAEGAPGRFSKAGLPRLCSTILRGEGGKLIACGFDGLDAEFYSADSAYSLVAHEEPEAARRFESSAISKSFPDYSDADFSRYLHIVEGSNPMHSLWSGTKWMKCVLAYGCYWRRCVFCDVSLDYIRRYAPTEPEALFRRMLGNSSMTGSSGVHLVDEAAPIPLLVRFGMENLKTGRPLVFWGNARFERLFTPDTAAFLAESGLVGISGGIEVASARGLKATGKGLSIADIVSACYALKTNGILVHAYLIYGSPGQEIGDIADSMEIVRQLFAEGIIDSAFWHKFVLTRHSAMYRDWLAGDYPSLEPKLPEWSFGSNDLSFAGEEGCEKFGEGLDAALSSWMEGEELERPIRDWFDFPFPAPRVPKNAVRKLVEAAEKEFYEIRPQKGKRMIWLGGDPVLELRKTKHGQAAARLTWAYRNRLESLLLEKAEAQLLIEALLSCRPKSEGLPTEEEFLGALGAEGFRGDFRASKAYANLRRNGLFAVSGRS